MGRSALDKATRAVPVISSQEEWLLATVGVRLGCLILPILVDILLEQLCHLLFLRMFLCVVNYSPFG